MFTVKKSEFIKSAEYEKDFPKKVKLDVVMIGRSNVGKSSLINAILNRKSLARVSKNPGCTQLINFFLLNDNFFLVDLPGYGFANLPDTVKRKWRDIIEEYLQSDRPKKAVVLVDVKRGIEEEEQDILDWLKDRDIRYCIVYTKVDKLTKNDLRERIRLEEGKAEKAYFVSSRSKENIPKLLDTLFRS